MKLKDVFPLYLNNKAVQPNTDLAVTDKFTGAVAFRTALATPDVIDAAKASPGRAHAPMARRPSDEKRELPGRCVGRFLEILEQQTSPPGRRAGPTRRILRVG